MKYYKKLSLLFFPACILITAAEAQVKILFDASKAQMCANADWVIDADLHNIGTNSSNGAMVVGLGNESNPTRFPTPAQSGVTAATAETYWNGSLSSWGIACAKLGYQVETLTYSDSITYGNATHAQDLSNYNVFIVDEPNIRFTLAERNALVKFVQNGGGLFMVSDHTVSDRNNDGWDSPAIWNDIMSTNTVQNNPFGMTFDLANFSETTTNFNVLPTDSVLHGPAGNPTQMIYNNGTSMTLSTAANPTVVGVVYKTGSAHGSTNVMMAHCYYGRGKVAALGDSSPPDDGTGDPNDALFAGWTDAGGDHGHIIINATIWLVTGSTTTGVVAEPTMAESNFMIYPNPASDKLFVTCYPLTGKESTLGISNIVGSKLYSQRITNTELQTVIDISAFSKGIYFVSLSDGQRTITKKLVKVQ